MKNEYTLNDVGCYVDSARGSYAVDRIVEIAESHGFEFELNSAKNDIGMTIAAIGACGLMKMRSNSNG